MCSPVGHSLFGLIGYYIFNTKYNILRYWKLAFFYIFFANLPDIDFLPVVWGNLEMANCWHHTYTHTLGFSILSALLVYLVCVGLKRKDGLKISVIVFILVFLHIIVDYFTVDSRYPYGVMLWWPISSRYFIAACPIFMPLKKATMDSFISWFNLSTILSEIMKIGPVVFILFIYRIIREKRH